MNGMLTTPSAVLGELDLALYLFFILATPVVNTLTVLAGKFDESIL